MIKYKSRVFEKKTPKSCNNHLNAAEHDNDEVQLTVSTQCTDKLSNVFDSKKICGFISTM